ncbi:MAG: DUF3040 domain-containing protein [Steroidobacteraceae bacterium]
MALSSDESRRLDEIGRQLSRNDPRLNRILSSGTPPRARLRYFGGWLLLVGAMTLTIGVLGDEAVLCALAWIGVLLGGLVMGSSYLDHRSTPDRSRP